MSRRFGRNQRRRLNALVEDMAQREELARQEAAMLRERLDRSRSTVLRVRDVLGRHFVGLEPELVRCNDPQAQGYVRLMKQRSVGPAAAMDGRADADVSHAMHLLETMQTRVVRDDLSNRVHVRVQGAVGPAVLAISREALVVLGRRDAAREIALALAEQLTQELPR